MKELTPEEFKDIENKLEKIRRFLHERDYYFHYIITHEPYKEEKERSEFYWKMKYMDTEEYKEEFRKHAQAFIKKHAR